MVHQGRKTDPPLLPSPVLFRRELLQKLEEALIPSPPQQSTVCKLVLLRAPAGYGKTTLIADFAKRHHVPIGWYFLDRTDTQLSVFLETLTALFCQTFPDLQQTFTTPFLHDLVAAIQSGNHTQYQQILHIYTNALEQCILHPFILCLCNYQEVNDSESLQILLNHLLQKMPSKLSLIIESRAVPVLELSPLIAYRQLLGLGSNALGFSPQEVREYWHLQHGFPITQGEAERLATTFDGWIAGMLLATPLDNLSPLRAGQPSHASWISPALFTDQHTLLSYVKNDVFATESQAFTFLQETSLFHRLSAPQCNHLLQIEHAEALLTHIEKQGLFLTRVPDQRIFPTYALHPAIRQLLSEDLHRRHLERAANLHRRAAELFHSWGDDEQAITHAIVVQEYTFAIDIIVKVALLEPKELMLKAALARWFEMLPVPVREQHPHLLLIRATLYLTQHEHLPAVPLLERAYELVMRRSSTFDEDIFPTLLAEILIARSTILFQEGNYTQAQQLCREALGYLPADKTELRVPAFLRLGICKTLLGDYTEGISYLQQALHFSKQVSPSQQTAYIHSCLANSYSLICNYALAEHHRTRAITLYEDLNDTQGKMNNLIWMAILKRNKGAFQEAETMLQDILRQARQAGFHSGEAYTLFNLGANYVDTNALPQALTTLEESLTLAHQIGDSRLVDQCLCELAMAYLLLEDSHTAQILLTQTTVASTKQNGYEALGYELVRGTTFLYQKDFVNAYTCFHTLEPLAQKTQMKRTHIECLIRLAVCQYRLSLFDKMETSMEKVVQLVAQGHFEHVPLIELRRFPEVWQAVQKFPAKACLHLWRDGSQEPGEDEEAQEQNILSIEQKSSLEPSPRSKLHIQAFGEPGVLIDGLVTRWHMARSMEMCFFLLDYQRPIRKEQLVEALWSEEGEYVDQTVRSALHYLRKAIGKPCITSHGGVYTLDLTTLYGDNIWYDVTLFQNHHTLAQEALDTEDNEQAEGHLRAMVELYGGDYVQSFFSNWCIPRRDELRRQYMDARRELARITWSKEQWEESMAHWQQMLALDPCSEEAHYGLMRGYARLGKRNLAIRQYQRCADIMQQELAISPAPAIQKFYQRLTNNH